MEVCKSNSDQLCFVDFLISLGSSLSILLNVVSFAILTKTTPKADIK